MKEHAGDECRGGATSASRAGSRAVPKSTAGIMPNPIALCSMPLPTETELPEKDDHASSDETIGHDRKPARRRVVAEWDGEKHACRMWRLNPSRGKQGGARCWPRNATLSIVSAKAMSPIWGSGKGGNELQDFGHGIAGSRQNDARHGAGTAVACGSFERRRDPQKHQQGFGLQPGGPNRAGAADRLAVRSDRQGRLPGDRRFHLSDARKRVSPSSKAARLSSSGSTASNPAASPTPTASSPRRSVSICASSPRAARTIGASR